MHPNAFTQGYQVGAVPRPHPVHRPAPARHPVGRRHVVVDHGRWWAHPHDVSPPSELAQVRAAYAAWQTAIRLGASADLIQYLKARLEAILFT